MISRVYERRVRRPGRLETSGFAAVPRTKIGAIAQLGERVLCKHDVVGSIPSGSTIFAVADDIASRGWLSADVIRDRRDKVSIVGLAPVVFYMTS